VSWYVLKFGSVQIGDEVVVPSGDWLCRFVDVTTDRLGQQVLNPSSVAVKLLLQPSFRIRKHADSMWHFERWVFDTACWADGRWRDLEIFDQDDNLVVYYGPCIMEGVRRPHIEAPQRARYSNDIVVTFQTNDTPQFYLS